MPCFSVVTNFALTNVVIRSSHLTGIVVMAVIYGFVNYKETKARGKPLYSFLTWNDYTSVIIYAGLITGFSLVFLLLSKLT